MPTEIRLPELAESMSSATLTTWLKKVGDRVSAGEPIAEVETDKTTVELESPADGVLLDISVAAGTDNVEVGALLALLGDRSDVADESKSTGATEANAPRLTEFVLPELTESMTSATIAGWLKKIGDHVSVGEPIVEVETDKTTVELESPADGVVTDISVASGTEGVVVGTVLAKIGASDDIVNKPLADGDVVEVVPHAPNSKTAESATRPNHVHESVDKTTKSVAEIDASLAAADVTPLARRMAALTGVDLADVCGSGAEGRIKKVDIDQQLSVTRGSAVEPAVGLTTAHPGAGEDFAGSSHVDEPLTGMRRVTAERMTLSKQTIPHFYLEIDCEVDRLLSLRDRKNMADEASTVTVNDVVVRAAAMALMQVPRANSSWTGEAVLVFDSVDIAVAVTTPKGLVTPVVRSANTKALDTIAAELHALADQARDGKLQAADYSGATCTISNLGMFGVSSLYAILNPPQSCILGVGAIERRPVARGDSVDVGAVMTVTLSADHRAIDGATGAELLREFKRFVENPEQIFK